MDAHMKSGMAVQECIRALSQTPTKSLKAEATLIPDDLSRAPGSVFITFEIPNPSDFPILTFDLGIMKSFGIPHGSFNPNFEIFSFKREGMELRLIAAKNGFTLSGIRPV
jgi:hypothetical protein